MKFSPGVKGIAHVVLVLSLGAGLPLYVASAANEPQATAGKPAIPGLKAPGGAPNTLSALTVVAPSTGPLNPASAVTIKWTGGQPGSALTLVLVDYDAWTSLGSIATGVVNSGSQTFNWTLPAALPCNRNYGIYIQQASPVFWTYGPGFRLKCDVVVTKQIVGSTYVIKLVNGAYPIHALTTPGSQQTASIPTFTVVDTLAAGLSFAAGNGTVTTLGSWTPTTLGATVGLAMKTIKFTLNGPGASSVIPAGGLIAQYTLTGVTIPKNCVSETMTVSDQASHVVNIVDASPANNTNVCAP
jgi:hypothetical protein